MLGAEALKELGDCAGHAVAPARKRICSRSSSGDSAWTMTGGVLPVSRACYRALTRPCHASQPGNSWDIARIWASRSSIAVTRWPGT
jgi:hypothetical protein